MASSGIINSHYGKVEVPNMSLTDFCLEKADEFKDRDFLIDGATGKALTFSGLKAGIRKFGQGLSEKGFKKGDVFAIYMPNVKEYAVAFHAVASLGGVVTTCNPLYTAEELGHQLKDAGAKMLLTVGAFADKAKEAVGKVSSVEEIIVLGNKVAGTTPFASLCDNDGSKFPKVAIDPNDVVALPYSSGTTGLPKGVMLTHRNIVANLVQIDHPDLVDLSPKDTLVGLLPFFHIYGMVVILNAALRKGAGVVVMPRFDPKNFLEYLSKYKVTIAHVVPPIVLFLAKHPLVDQFDLSNLKEVFSGAAPLGKELAAAVVERLKLESFRQGWGMTEMSPVGLVSPAKSDKYGSAGKLIPSQECKIVDIETKECITEPNKEGEIWVRGPNIMKGYLNNKEATEFTIDKDNFLHTGDIGYVDKDGHFYIVDRLKELIKYKGFQVAPAELEALLLAHEKIADAAVIGKPDVEAGEIPKAYIVRKDPSVTEDEIMLYISEHVAPHKKIREVEFTDKIPKSGSGKILRRQLKAKERKAVEEQKSNK